MMSTGTLNKLLFNDIIKYNFIVKKDIQLNKVLTAFHWSTKHMSKQLSRFLQLLNFLIVFVFIVMLIVF